MEYVIVILVAAVIFGICYLVDKTFAKLFRSKAQHRSGHEHALARMAGHDGFLAAALEEIIQGLQDGRAHAALHTGDQLAVQTGE